MTEQTCVTDSCGRPVYDARVCVSCGDLLAQALGDVSALSDELDTQLSRQTSTGGYRIGGKSSEKPLPYDEGAREARIVLKSTLVSWVRELIVPVRMGGPMCAMCNHESCAAFWYEPWPADNLPAISRWLLASVEDIRQRDDGGMAVDEITAAVGNARRAIDRRAERVYAGPCAAMTGDTYGPVLCAADIYATLGKDRVKCAECGATYSLEERRQWMLDQLEGTLRTASECAAYGAALKLWSQGNADKVRKRINTWGNRKRLEVHGLTLEGVPMYRFGEAVAMVLERQAA